MKQMGRWLAAGAGAVSKLAAEIRKVPGFGERAAESWQPFMHRRFSRAPDSLT